MSLDRRDFLVRTLSGGALLGLRASMLGVPAAWLRSPRAALAQTSDGCAVNAPQFLVLSASDKGDPVNANAPGSFALDAIEHTRDPALAPTVFNLGGRSVTGAKPWAELAPEVLARTAFFHHATRAVAHPNHASVMALLGQTRAAEMLVSICARALAPCLGTVQREPVAVGAGGSGELLRFEGRSLAALSPRSLQTVLGTEKGPLGSLKALEALRDRDVDALHTLYKEHGTAAQRAMLDRMVQTRAEARKIPESLLDTLDAITANDVSGQILAASALIRMKITPVVTLHIPFGGDNHQDPEFADEVEETVSGVAAIDALLQRLRDDGLAEQTTFGLLNVFGRTLISSGRRGRNHNPNHAVSVLIGPRVRAGVIGGVVRSGNDVSAQPLDAASGAASAAGDVSVDASLASLGKTLGAALGLPDDLLAREILNGTVVRGALSG
jgi:Protein of unknown function (DUF1501)